MSSTSRKANVGLWIAQGLLAALFLFAGGFKLATPTATLAQMTPFSPLFIKFIGACEVAGALGLILPGIFRVRTDLTPLAAAGLSLIMIGAVTTTVASMGLAPAIFPFIVGILTITIARSRRQRATHRGAAFTARIQAAGGL
jgi:hypothetical protein